MFLQQSCFVESSGAAQLRSKTGHGLSISRRKFAHPSLRSFARVKMCAEQTQRPGQAPWPFGRFLKTALWFSPLGRMMRGNPVPSSMKACSRSADGSHSAPPRRDQIKVLVSGASGILGRRVVRELLIDGSAVKALVRDRDRALRALETVGVNVNDYGDRLDFVVADLHNLPEDLCSDIDAIVSCTGTRIGPSNDTEDRAMYRQGIQFYEPTVSEDTPEGVEYKGIKNLVERAVKKFESMEIENSPQHDQIPVLSFDTAEQIEATWGSLDDVVMGGVSHSRVNMADGVLVFSGMLSTDNSGGFASARTVDFPSPIDIQKYNGLRMRVKGDGKRYKFIVRCDNRWDGVSHCYSFDTVDGKWITVDAPFTSFNTVFRAKTLPNGKPLDPSHISAFQLMLSKFEYDSDLNPAFSAGPFHLQLDTVYAYNVGNVSSRQRPTFPKFVHIGSGGCTRVLRKDFPKSDDIPAVQMNEMLGRILEWKLAGEDVIRSSLAEYGYTIIRPCAMTETDPAGLASLDIAQGDNITGRVSRDDVARLVVEVLYSHCANKTFEVRENTDRHKGNQNLFDTAEMLNVDSDATSRNFGEFPYVPN